MSDWTVLESVDYINGWKVEHYADRTTRFICYDCGIVYSRGPNELKIDWTGMHRERCKHYG